MAIEKPTTPAIVLVDPPEVITPKITMHNVPDVHRFTPGLHFGEIQYTPMYPVRMHKMWIRTHKLGNEK